MTSAKGTLLSIVRAFGIVALVLAALVAVYYFSVVSTVMRKRSPDGQHTAKLVRVQSIDVNFKVYVNGRRVYFSPDFAPVEVDFRERLIWATNSQEVVLEVADRRIFGYHVGERRPLTESELHKVQVPPFESLGFEGGLPQEAADE
jgi:hypothetical protein